MTLSLAGLMCVTLAFLWERPPPAEAPKVVEVAQVPRSDPVEEVVVLPPPPLPPREVSAAVVVGNPEPAQQPTAAKETAEAAPPPVPAPMAAPAQPEKQVAAISPAKPREGKVQATTSAPAPRETRVDRQAVEEGRVFLRLMVQDKGPDIRIAWPDEGRRRDGLYRLLTACYGLKSAVLQEGGRLYVEGGARGESWAMNRDFYSSLLWAPEGRLPAREKALLRSIEAYHGVRGQAVRVLPRLVDAGIVGTLMQLAGGEVGPNTRITARYGFDETGVSLSDISVAGRRLEGTVRVPKLVWGCS